MSTAAGQGITTIGELTREHDERGGDQPEAGGRIGQICGGSSAAELSGDSPALVLVGREQAEDVRGQ
ncbi:hypothetical protein [Actinoplanes sp. NPDC026670]|uniref:hypothetical protein n=1 Tax=Actinoplanes sp. NPDC026670 TaxID=3154700 RepID=UPI003408BFD4